MDGSGETLARRYRIWSIVIFILYFVVLLAFLASCFREAFYHTSFTECWVKNRSDWKMPAFFQAKVIHDVVKALGLGTFLIALVYRKFDDRMLGVRYQDLLEHSSAWKGKSLYLLTGLHVFFVIACLATASAGTSESACISFIGVILGLLYHGFLLFMIIWNPKKCEKIATEYIYEKKDPYILPQIAAALPSPSDKHYQAHLSILARKMRKQVRELNEKEQSADLIIKNSAGIWNYVFSNTAECANDDRALALFVELCKSVEETNTEKAEIEIRLICGGFILNKVESLQKNQTKDTEAADLLLLLYAQLIVCSKKLVSTKICKDDGNPDETIHHNLMKIAALLDYYAFYDISVNEKEFDMPALRPRYLNTKGQIQNTVCQIISDLKQQNNYPKAAFEAHQNTVADVYKATVVDNSVNLSVPQCTLENQYRSSGVAV